VGIWLEFGWIAGGLRLSQEITNHWSWLASDGDHEVKSDFA
jgi:hypothetical protein